METGGDRRGGSDAKRFCPPSPPAPLRTHGSTSHQTPPNPKAHSSLPHPSTPRHHPPSDTPGGRPKHSSAAIGVVGVVGGHEARYTGALHRYRRRTTLTPASRRRVLLAAFTLLHVLELPSCSTGPDRVWPPHGHLGLTVFAYSDGGFPGARSVVRMRVRVHAFM